MTQTATFDTTPKPALLLAMQNQKWTVAGALSELVDNSFGSGRGNATRVHITHDTKHRTITVLDNGVGMESIGRLFQFGNTIGRSPGDIGIYGAGGTMALLWLAERVEVYTLRDGQVSSDGVRWKDHFTAEHFPVVDASWRRATLANTPAELFELGHGTLIRLHLLPARTFQGQNVRRDLGRIYSPALRRGRHLFWTTRGKGGLDTQPVVDPLATGLDGASKRVAVNCVVEVGEDHLPVQGVIGIINDLPQEQSLVSIGFGPRVITSTRECYTSPNKNERYAGIGVAGWLDLGEGWQPYLTTTKDGVNDGRAWNALMAHVFAQIRPLLQEKQQERLSLELEDLRLMLAAVVDGRARVSLPTERKEKEEEGTEKTTERTDVVDNQKKPRPVDPEGPERPQHGRTQIDIQPISDHEIGGVLCKAVARDLDAVEVFVNREHPLVQEALETRPVNRKMLNVMVVSEMAAVIIQNAPLLERIFSRGTLLRLEGREHDNKRGLVIRILMDGVREQVKAA